MKKVLLDTGLSDDWESVHCNLFTLKFESDGPSGDVVEGMFRSVRAGFFQNLIISSSALFAALQ